jgi:hypothetical protein
MKLAAKPFRRGSESTTGPNLGFGLAAARSLLPGSRDQTFAAFNRGLWVDGGIESPVLFISHPRWSV